MSRFIDYKRLEDMALVGGFLCVFACGDEVERFKTGREIKIGKMGADIHFNGLFLTRLSEMYQENKGEALGPLLSVSGDAYMTRSELNEICDLVI